MAAPRTVAPLLTVVVHPSLAEATPPLMAIPTRLIIPSCIHVLVLTPAPATTRPRHVTVLSSSLPLANTELEGTELEGTERVAWQSQVAQVHLPHRTAHTVPTAGTGAGAEAEAE